MHFNNVNVEIVDEAKNVGTHITNHLKWDRTTEELVKKENTRLQLLRKMKSFKAPMKYIGLVYITFIRSIL